MSLYTNISATLLVMSILFASSRSGSFRNRTKISEKEALPTSSTPTHVNNGTTNTRPSLQSTTSTLPQSTQKTKKPNNFTTVSPTEGTSKPLRTAVTAPVSRESVTNSTSPREKSAQRVEKRSTVLVVTIVLPFCLLMVGIVVAVFFVRWKRIKKMKQGFQEEMAVICLHDELASEALYSSWKPFMDGNDNNKVKLVIETQPSNVSPTATNS
ncbi:uncharacterized protein LOC110062729 [Orbicella faveolata]|uniref:uncharacterized protein LOC110062729 n=1 Tax=Orbicella faveolata TaxID=48498 RepID=UPI0009E414B2|nr:uncharacterized protein LOC110062729 [Orbicella faveolata]